jgi:hypothetical protein
MTTDLDGAETFVSGLEVGALDHLAKDVHPVERLTQPLSS